MGGCDVSLTITTMLSVFVTVAAPQGLPFTSIAESVRTIVVGVPPEIEIVAVADPKEQFAAAFALGTSTNVTISPAAAATARRFLMGGAECHQTSVPRQSS